MYSEIINNSTLDIQGIICHVPPQGYVINIKTGELEPREIHKRSEIITEQYWERIPLPEWYKAKMKEEDYYNKKKRKDDIPYFDEQLEEYTKIEWDRRLNGFWFYNKGIPTYITGAHYVYLQWWQIDIGYPKFRITDLEYFYFLQYCIEDPDCMGMLEITKRRFGKTFRGGLFLYDYVTRTREANGGIQSKTGADAKKMFGKAVIKPFKKLPRFFRPEYDMSLGITPKTEIRFQQTNVRGKEAEELLDKEELGSLIDFQSADTLAYDGQKIHRYFGDEWAKTIEADIYERHEVIRYCLMDDEGKIIGKALYSSTVEQLDTEREGVQEAAIKLWNDSDQSKKGEDGRTVSGLYRFFMTADRTRFIDKYGYADVEKTIQAILTDREKVKNNQKAYAARLRKEARTIDEAFYAGNFKCEFNAEAITNQLKKLEIEPVFLRRVRLVLNKKKFPKIIQSAPDKIELSVTFMDDENGGWLIYELPYEKHTYIDGGYIDPTQKHLFQIGVDTIKDEFSEHGSKPTICVLKKSLTVGGEEKGMYPVAIYDDRTRLDVHFDDEVLKACMLWGCSANYELDARTDYYRYFYSKGAVRMLEWTPKFAQDPTKPQNKIKPGTQSADPFQLAAQLQVAKMYIDGTSPEIYNGHVHRIVFPIILQQLLKYDHSDRTKSDQVIALIMSLLPIMGEQEMPYKEEVKIRQLLPTYKIQKVN